MLLGGRGACRQPGAKPARRERRLASRCASLCRPRHGGYHAPAPAAPAPAGHGGARSAHVAAVVATDRQWSWRQREVAGRGPGADQATYLEELKIQDFALVAYQTVKFAPGLNAITGESGSGKSVLIEALGQLLGNPAPPECVRTPATSAVLEGNIVLSPAAARRVAAAGAALGLPERALPAVNGSLPARLVLKREITTLSVDEEHAAHDAPPDDSAHAGGSTAPAPAAAASGELRALRSRCYVNGAITSLRVLRALGAELFDTNGQHAAIGLRDSDTQLALLDRIAGNSALAACVASRQARLCALHELLHGLDALGDEAERARVSKLVALVNKAGIEPGEERQLRAQLRSMEARRSSLEMSVMLRSAIRGESGGGGLLDGLRTVTAQLNGLIAAEEGIMLDEARTGEASAAASSGDAAAPASANGAAASNGAAANGAGAAARDSDAAAGAQDAADEDDEEDDGPQEPSGLEHLEASLDALENARAALQAAADQLSSYAQQHAFSTADWADVTARLDVIERLMRSQRARTSEALLDAVAASKARLDAYYDAEGKRGEWEAEAAELKQQLLRDSLKLSTARQAGAGRLRAAVEECLGQLAMNGCRFDVRISWEPAGQDTLEAECVEVAEDEALALGQPRGGEFRIRSQGLDVAEFLLAAGPSEPLRPLAAVASGGESARVMLALKAAPAAAAAGAAAAARAATSTGGAGSPGDASDGGDDLEGDVEGGSTPVLVLDELDSGVGSRLGHSVGRLLRRMCGEGGGGAAASQVLCVTHLPQVAAHAPHHIVVSKPMGARTETRFDALLTEAARLREIAAMMGSGGEEAARQLLAEAAQAQR